MSGIIGALTFGLYMHFALVQCTICVRDALNEWTVSVIIGTAAVLMKEDILSSEEAEVAFSDISAFSEKIGVSFNQRILNGTFFLSFFNGSNRLRVKMIEIEHIVELLKAKAECAYFSFDILDPETGEIVNFREGSLKQFVL